MQLFCSTCTNRIDGKLDILDIIVCHACGRCFTIAELKKYNDTLELQREKDLRGGNENKRLG